MIIVRKLLEFVFTRQELKILDDIMPESTKRKRHEEKANTNLVGGGGDDKGTTENVMCMAIPLSNGNILKINSTNGVNEVNKRVFITEQLTKSNAWKSINEQKSYDQ